MRRRFITFSLLAKKCRKREDEQDFADFRWLYQDAKRYPSLGAAGTFLADEGYQHQQENHRHIKPCAQAAQDTIIHRRKAEDQECANQRVANLIRDAGDEVRIDRIQRGTANNKDTKADEEESNRQEHEIELPPKRNRSIHRSDIRVNRPGQQLHAPGCDAQLTRTHRLAIGIAVSIR